MTYKRKCPICGEEFETTVYNKRFCSPQCRGKRKSSKGRAFCGKVETYVKLYCPEDCMYRNDRGMPSCDYLIIEGEPRGCPVEGCTKYKKGKAQKQYTLPTYMGKVVW